MTNHIYYFEVLGRNDRNRFGIESFNDARSIDLVLFEGLPEMGAYIGRLSRDSYISTNGGPIREISKMDRKNTSGKDQKKQKMNKNKEFFLLHGYTGSPTDFNGLGDYLNKRFNIDVRIIRLKGHGTKIEDLDDLKLEHFLEQVDVEFKKDLAKGKKIVVGGISFGAQLALYLASKYNIEGVFTVSIPYKLKFPLNVPFLGILGFFKKKWRKRLPPLEIELRKGSFHYKEMHANGLKIIKKASKLNSKNLHKIYSPILNIHSKKEPTGNYRSVEIIERKVRSKIKESLIFERTNHNLFFSEDKDEIIKLIGDFFDKHNVFGFKKREKVSAIIPSYNEGKRIANVLKVLVRTKVLDEIIVVDDGSVDDTEKIVKEFKGVKYFKNDINMGKGYSMDKGVKNSKGEIIFFCDADVIGLKSEIIMDTLRPVINNEVDMFISVRGNFMQRAVTLFGVNSGERALRRGVWEKLPDYYKHRYRIEAGLNSYVTKFGNGYGYKVFPYTQPIKEKKYGFFKGTFLRWKMNFDVLNAYLSCLFMSYLINLEKKKKKNENKS